MLSQKQIKSFIRITDHSQNNQQSKHFLNLSKKQLRKIPEIDYSINGSDSIDVSFNYLKSLLAIKLKNFQEKIDDRNPQSSISSESQIKAKYLEWLDISFNFLTTIHQYQPIQMKQFSNLKYMNASANRIQQVNLSDQQFPSLQSLHLKNNKIVFFTFAPKNLQILSLDNNQLGTLAFKGGQSLQILSASKNKIKKLAIDTPNLLFLDLQSNNISQLKTVINQLQKSKNILSLNLLQNEVSEKKQLKVQILSICGRIVQLNQTYISPHIREGFRILKEQEKLDQVLQNTAQQYQKNLQQQLKYKQQMLQKLKVQSQSVQENFRKYVQMQKEQMRLLQMHAKNTLAQSRFRITTETQEFNKKLIEQNLSNYKQKSQLKGNNLKPKHNLRQIAQFGPEQNNEKNFKRTQKQYKQQYQNYKNEKKNKEKYKHPHSNLKSNETQIQQQNSDSQNMSIVKNMQSRVNNQKPSKKEIKPHLNYRASRQSIQLLGAQKLNKKSNQIQIQHNSSKQIPGAYFQSRIKKQKSPIQSKQENDEIVDLRCIGYLQKYYTFY